MLAWTAHYIRRQPPGESAPVCRASVNQTPIASRMGRVTAGGSSLPAASSSMAEILRFVAVDYELTGDAGDWDWKSAMDSQVLQKILPKLHGSKRKIGALLAALAKYCETGSREDALKLLGSDTEADAYPADLGKRFASPSYKESHGKLCEMIVTLRRDQFVSFIQ